jgi:hypothetical protein
MFHTLIYECNGKLYHDVYTNIESAKADLKRYGNHKGVIISANNPSCRNYGLIEDLTDHSDELR